MIELVDFSNCERSNRDLQYAGRSGEKRGIIYKGENWFLKFPKNTLGMHGNNLLSYSTSPLSEYLGSHVFEILGIDTHQTVLGICFDGKRYKVVCACKDFIRDDQNELLIPYTAIRNDTKEDVMEMFRQSLRTSMQLSEIIYLLDNNEIFKSIPEAKERFWDCVVIDLLINNNDRNDDNFGVIKFRNTGKYILAPVYDCGNSFYAKYDDEKFERILSISDVFNSSALGITTAYFKENGDRMILDDFVNFKNDDFMKSVKKIIPLVEQQKSEIIKLFNDLPFEYNGVEVCSKLRREYYLKSFLKRFERLKTIIH